MKTFFNMVATLCIVASFSANANEAYGSYDDSPTKPFDASIVRHETVKITWKRVNNKSVTEICKAEGLKRNHQLNVQKLDACSFWDGSECMIISGKNSTMHDLGHETRHCFQGSWH